MQIKIKYNNGGQMAAIIYWYMFLKDAYCGLGFTLTYKQLILTEQIKNNQIIVS